MNLTGRSSLIDALAALVAASDSNSAARSLLAVVAAAVEHDGASLLAFHRHAAPAVIAHTLNPELERHFLDRYLAGPYLLDPLYRIALQPAPPAFCRFREAAPDRFRASEYYRHYCERTHLTDEIDYFAKVGPTTALVLVVGRLDRRFSQSALRDLEMLAPLVRSGLQRVGSPTAGTGDTDPGFHQRLIDCFDNFGNGVLTRREREICQFLLRGHSGKSVARELDIAPGTVTVHKRNLFAKLGIRSQYELFSLFIAALPGGDGGLPADRYSPENRQSRQ